jgi:hypothetical protein
MTIQILRDRGGKRLGEIRERDGILEIFSYSGRRMGSYDPRTNVTKDYSGKTIGAGNLLTTLL